VPPLPGPHSLNTTPHPMWQQPGASTSPPSRIFCAPPLAHRPRRPSLLPPSPQGSRSPNPTNPTPPPRHVHSHPSPPSTNPCPTPRLPGPPPPSSRCPTRQPSPTIPHARTCPNDPPAATAPRTPPCPNNDAPPAPRVRPSTPHLRPSPTPHTPAPRPVLSTPPPPPPRRTNSPPRSPLRVHSPSPGESAITLRPPPKPRVRGLACAPRRTPVYPVPPHHPRQPPATHKNTRNPTPTAPHDPPPDHRDCAPAPAPASNPTHQPPTSLRALPVHRLGTTPAHLLNRHHSPLPHTRTPAHHRAHSPVTWAPFSGPAGPSFRTPTPNNTPTPPTRLVRLPPRSQPVRPLPPPPPRLHPSRTAPPPSPHPHPGVPPSPGSRGRTAPTLPPPKRTPPPPRRRKK